MELKKSNIYLQNQRVKYSKMEILVYSWNREKYSEYLSKCLIMSCVFSMGLLGARSPNDSALHELFESQTETSANASSVANNVTCHLL